METDARRVVYRGHVQGVGFRARTNRLAIGYAVSGSVKNLHDGSVEILVRGPGPEIDRFLDALTREFGPNIVSVENSPFLSESIEPSGFSIRY